MAERGGQSPRLALGSPPARRAPSPGAKRPPASSGPLFDRERPTGALTPRSARRAELLGPSKPSLPPSAPTTRQLEAREEAVQQLRAERLATELHVVRGALAASHSKVEQLEASRLADKALLSAELEQSTRAEQKERSRADFAEREMRVLRSKLGKRQAAEARAVAHEAAVEAVATQVEAHAGREEGLRAVRQRAWDALAARVLAWSRRQLPAALATWRVAANALELEAARRGVREAFVERRGDAEATELQEHARRRRAEQGRAQRRLGTALESLVRVALLRALHAWRGARTAAAAAAAVAEASAAGGALKADARRAAAKQQLALTAERDALSLGLRRAHALARVAARRADALMGWAVVRREGLQGAWRRWLVLLLSSRCGAAAREALRLRGAERGEAHVRGRADGLGRELHQLRGVLASLQQKAATAHAAAEAARAEAEREAAARAKAEVARRADRQRCEQLEREKLSLQRHRRGEREAAAPRLAALALCNAVACAAQLAQAAAFGRWRWIAASADAPPLRLLAAGPASPVAPSGWFYGLAPPTCAAAAAAASSTVVSEPRVLKSPKVQNAKGNRWKG